MIGSGYQGAFPFLRIAQETGIDYGIVLALAGWFDEEPFPCMDKNRFRALFEVLDAMSDEDAQRLMERVSIARRHFTEQQGGLRDMDGHQIVKALKENSIVDLASYRRARL